MGKIGRAGSLGFGAEGTAGIKRKKLQCSKGILEAIATVNGYLRQCRCRLALMNITPSSCLKNSGRCLLSTSGNLYTFPFSILLKAAPIGNCVLKGIHRPVLGPERHPQTSASQVVILLSSPSVNYSGKRFSL